MTEAALAATGDSFYASHNWHPYFIEGTQTLAFELWEQLGFRLPDNILVPTGYGSNILGLERGFDALERAGEISARPRLFAVQAANCAAFAAAWNAGVDGLVPFAANATVADGIATIRPVRPAAVLRALRRSKGGVVAVAEDEIAPATRALGRLGLFVEPTAATAGAALSRLLRDRVIAAGETTVAVLTGHGLKAAERIGDLLDVGGHLVRHCDRSPTERAPNSLDQQPSSNGFASPSAGQPFSIASPRNVGSTGTGKAGIDRPAAASLRANTPRARK